MSETQTQEPKKIIVNFMHTDESGQPIIDPRTGKQAFTNLVADTPEEMIEKQKETYINVMRAYHRARNSRPVPAAPAPAPKVFTPEEERQLVAEVVDPVKGKEAIRKLAGTEELERDREETRKERAAANAQKAAYQFMSRHISDYFPCAANGAMLSEYINENQLDPTVADNYEVAFQAVQHKLAERPAPAPAPQPEPRQPAGGIQPGELSGRRPTIQRKQNPMTKDGPLTLEDVKRMKNTPEGRAEWARRAKNDPAFYPAVNALLAKR